jgi:exonuclease VII large subunit
LGQDKDKDKDEKHKPCKVVGEIAKVSPDHHHFVVKEAGGKHRLVCCDRECKITQGDRKLTCKDLKAGMRVSVTGHEACLCEPGKFEGAKACKVAGEVTQISPDKHHFTVKDADGMPHHVCCGGECKVAVGKKTLSCKDLKVGMKVRVSGHEACHCATVRILPKTKG